MRDEQANTSGPERAIAKMPEGLMNASREKTWDECGIEEKVERLRRELRAARDMSQYVATTAVSAKDTAERHQHGPHGEVLMPVQRHGAEAGSIGRGFDPLR